MKDNNTLNFIANGSCFNTDFGNTNSKSICEFLIRYYRNKRNFKIDGKQRK